MRTAQRVQRAQRIANSAILMRRYGRIFIKGLELFVQCSRITGTSQLYIHANSIDRKVGAG
jgi:hypothetical protein